MKFYRNIATRMPLHFIYGSFHTKMAKLSSWHRDNLAWKICLQEKFANPCLKNSVSIVEEVHIGTSFSLVLWYKYNNKGKSYSF